MNKPNTIPAQTPITTSTIAPAISRPTLNSVEGKKYCIKSEKDTYLERKAKRDKSTKLQFFC